MNCWKCLSQKEKLLWVISVSVVSISTLFSSMHSPLILISSVIGVSALLFVGKGYVIGQILTAVFAVLYAIVSYELKYYGEMITYVGMSAPIALMSAYVWYKNPYKDTKEVKAHKINTKETIQMIVYAMIVTFIFHFILKYFSTAHLYLSTLSITTSFLACYLTYLRSPYYAIGYALNDIVLILLWILASIKDAMYIPMIFCFIMFLVNDLYGFYNWRKMVQRQKM